MEDITQTIGTLTSLIDVNNTREKVYKSLAEKMRHKELRSLFAKYSEQSRQFSSALSIWRAAYGGDVALPGSTGGIGTVRARMAVMLAYWLGRDLVSRCEEMEKDTLREYRAAIRNCLLPASTAIDVEKQSQEFEKALAKLRILREHLGSNGSVFSEHMHTPAF